MNSHCLTKDEHDYLCNVLDTIHLLNWQLLEALIISNPKKFEAVSKAVSASDALNGMTILHAAIRCNPPPNTVKLITRLTPFAARAVDVIGRTPLHIAAGIRAHPQSIKILVDACCDACAFQDADGRTPLHFACDVNW
jgi:ankyrin repeat protein